MLKITSFLIIGLSLVCNCQSQEIAFNLPRDLHVYRGINNPIHVVVEGIKCENVFLKTSNGRLSKTKCSYDYAPDSVPNAKIEIYIKQGGKLKRIGVRWVGVQDIPPPVAYVGDLNGGEIKKGFLRAQQGVGAQFQPGLGIDLTYAVLSFMAIIIRDNKIIFSSQNAGNLFSKDIQDAFKDVKNNDKLLITDIKCKGPGDKDLSSKTLEFVIIE